MIHRFALATVLIVVASSSPIQAETLEQLRDNYQKAHETSSNIEDPKFGTEGFREKLAVWADGNKKSQLAAQKLISALFKRWIEQPNDETLKTEIESVYQGLAGKRSTERHTNAKSFITRISWPLLTDSELTDEQAELLSKLIKPRGVSRIGDVMARVRPAIRSLRLGPASSLCHGINSSGQRKTSSAGNFEPACESFNELQSQSERQS